MELEQQRRELIAPELALIARVKASDAAAAALTFDLLSASNHSLPYTIDGRIGTWLTRFSDVAFVHLECFPEPPKEHKRHLLIHGGQYRYKYLPDVDGNSFSGRWRAFLKSTSMPLKATIYAEWHDDRMVLWVHFVPFDASYKDIYAVIEYFLDGRDA
ncbi:hypothetical protein MY11210_006521 [Beauveria gryllotalpidicola]